VSLRGAHHDGPLERIRAERLAMHLGDRLEPNTVVGTGDDNADAATVGQRSTDSIGKPEHVVDETRARRSGPVAGSGIGGRNHDDCVVEAGEWKGRESHESKVYLTTVLNVGNSRTFLRTRKDGYSVPVGLGCGPLSTEEEGR
jgi:hypothetical protein